jgi:hypothetical protein
VIGDFFRGVWAPTLAAVILLIVWQVAARVWQEETKSRQFFRDQRLRRQPGESEHVDRDTRHPIGTDHLL